MADENPAVRVLRFSYYFLRLGRPLFLIGGFLLHGLGVVIALTAGASLNVSALIWGQIAVVRWNDGLAALSLRARDPKEWLEKLKQVGEHTFRWIRDDDKSLGEIIRFEVAEDGTVTRFEQHSNWYLKVR